MTLQEAVETKVKAELSDISTRGVFPQIYEGFLEIEAIAQGEDAILRILQNVIYRFFCDSNLQTLTERACESFESHLGIAPVADISARRQNIIAAINNRFVFNEAALAAKIEDLANGAPMRFEIDSRNLTLRLWREGDEANGSFLAYEIAKVLKPIIPQNIEVITEARASVDYGYFLSMTQAVAINSTTPSVFYY